VSSFAAKALAVPGWMSPQELEWLEQQAKGAALAVEFGSWCGRSSMALSAAKLLVCVDTWAGSPEHADIVATVNPWETWHDTMRDGVRAGAVRPIRGNLRHAWVSDGLLSQFNDRADLVFVDANHDFTNVLADISLAYRLVRPGGIVAGHDYGTDWECVKMVVDEYVRNFDVVEDTSIWFARRSQ
jgi:predicted O-methyltransferase YrrM